MLTQRIKNYKKLKIKSYLCQSKLTLLCTGTNKKTENWLAAKQDLKSNKMYSYKICNISTKKIFEKSIFNFATSIVHGITFFIQTVNPQKKHEFGQKMVLDSILEPLPFHLLAIKFNNKMYSVKQFTDIKSINYKKSKLIIYKLKNIIMKMNLKEFEIM